MRMDFKNVQVQSSVLRKGRERCAVFFSNVFVSGTTQITAAIPGSVCVL